jgi:hypothetical protein
MVNFGQKTAQIAICLALFACALFFRASGVDYGMFNGDERINDAARFLAGELIPTQHFYPPFFNYLNSIALVGLFGFGLLTDMWASTGEFRHAYFTDPMPFYLAARYLTAAIGALIAPIFYFCARRADLGMGLSIGVAAMAAVFPIAVFMSHTAKGDTALAVACLAVCLAFLMRIGATKTTRWNIIIGIAVALAFGFKQSALLVLGPLALAMLVVLSRRESVSSALTSFGVAVAVVVVLWPIMNIGVLLDIDGFLAFQKIQTVMSVREQDGFGAGLPITLAILGDAVVGLNPVLFAMACVTPFWLASSSCRLQFKDVLLGMWSANAVSTISISLIVGTRQPEHLFLPNLYIFLLLTALILADMLRVYVRLPRMIIAVTSLVGFALLAAGAANVVRQAKATPAAVDLARFLAEEYPDARIQTGVALPVPQTVAAQRMEFDRWDRLGAKYDVVMPEIAPERILTEDADDALFWMSTPLVMSGLEGDSVQDAEFEVQPHAWPVQPEEWLLDTWLEAGFEVIVVNHFDYFLNDSLSSHIRAYHAELIERCEIVQEYEARKPLYLEFDITVFDCAGA